MYSPSETGKVPMCNIFELFKLPVFLSNLFKKITSSKESINEATTYRLNISDLLLRKDLTINTIFGKTRLGSYHPLTFIIGGDVVMCDVFKFTKKIMVFYHPTNEHKHFTRKEFLKNKIID